MSVNNVTTYIISHVTYLKLLILIPTTKPNLTTSIVGTMANVNITRKRVEKQFGNVSVDRRVFELKKKQYKTVTFSIAYRCLVFASGEVL